MPRSSSRKTASSEAKREAARVVVIPLALAERVCVYLDILATEAERTEVLNTYAALRKVVEAAGGIVP